MDILAQARDFGDWFFDHGLPILIVVLVALVVTFVARLAVNRFRRRLEGTASLTQELNLQRATTLTHALSTALIVVIWTIAILLVLGEFDINLGPLIASAGVAGVALGFGAQSVVRDTLSGFFILMENQFGVGDNVEIQTPSSKVIGRVESLTLRVTSLRAFDGTLHIVPNGNIIVASNRSRGWARAIVDVRAGYEEDVENLRRVLEELFEELKSDRTLSEWIHEGPSVLGVERMGQDALVMRVVADTRPSKVMDVERTLRERITRRLGERGIRVPVIPVAPAPAGADGR
ncbi:MAG TPA: mechanosensitive ion channel family protein [Actinomycetota bacterium]|nr:mechanosensitive ion channel family protein [Actinomycetota bacterium]